MTIGTRPLARCPAKACPVRYATGPDRDCGGHDQDGDVAAAALSLGIDLAPGDRGDGSDGGDDR